MKKNKLPFFSKQKIRYTTPKSKSQIGIFSARSGIIRLFAGIVFGLIKQEQSNNNINNITINSADYNNLLRDIRDLETERL
jgi:hypothetical protein